MLRFDSSTAICPAIDIVTLDAMQRARASVACAAGWGSRGRTALFWGLWVGIRDVHLYRHGIQIRRFGGREVIGLHFQHHIKAVDLNDALGKHWHAGEFSRIKPPGLIRRIITWGL